jgi:hypothetical protein
MEPSLKSRVYLVESTSIMKISMRLLRKPRRVLVLLGGLLVGVSVKALN